MRLIDVDKALNDINNIGFYTGKMSDSDYCEEIVNIIQNAPTVEERKRGHWIKNINGYPTYNCSNCKEIVSDELFVTNNVHFCLCCGAIMNEVSEDE